jgi:hypothetical protein
VSTGKSLYFKGLSVHHSIVTDVKCNSYHVLKFVVISCTQTQLPIHQLSKNESLNYSVNQHINKGLGTEQLPLRRTWVQQPRKARLSLGWEKGPHFWRKIVFWSNQNQCHHYRQYRSRSARCWSVRQQSTLNVIEIIVGTHINVSSLSLPRLMVNWLSFKIFDISKWTAAIENSECLKAKLKEKSRRHKPSTQLSS